MNVTAEYKNEDFGEDYGFDNFDSIHDSGETVVSDELYHSTDAPNKGESVFLENDTNVPGTPEHLLCIVDTSGYHPSSTFGLLSISSRIKELLMFTMFEWDITVLHELQT